MKGLPHLLSVIVDAYITDRYPSLLTSHIFKCRYLKIQGIFKQVYFCEALAACQIYYVRNVRNVRILGAATPIILKWHLPPGSTLPFFIPRPFLCPHRFGVGFPFILLEFFCGASRTVSFPRPYYKDAFAAVIAARKM
jgi:hypothetical protein